jgi:hypothetical protein
MKCLECDGELRAVVFAVYEYDGTIGKRTTGLDTENILSIFCSKCNYRNGPAKEWREILKKQ